MKAETEMPGRRIAFFGGITTPPPTAIGLPRKEGSINCSTEA